MPPRKPIADDGSRNLTQSAIPRVQLAIVSPCSTCKNQRDKEQDGKSACPRRALLRMQKESADAGQELSPSFKPALLTGTEGTDQEGTDTLRNPVYSDQDNHILVWVAHLQDNLGTYDSNGNATSTSLLDPSFDTDLIQCNGLPYVVRDTESVYFQNGAYKESDTLEVCGIRTYQIDPTDSDNPQPLKVEGYAHKVDLAYGFNRKHVDKDLSPRGT